MPFLVVSEQNRRGGTGGEGKVVLRGMKERRVLWDGGSRYYWKWIDVVLVSQIELSFPGLLCGRGWGKVVVTETRKFQTTITKKQKKTRG